MRLLTESDTVRYVYSGEIIERANTPLISGPGSHVTGSVSLRQSTIRSSSEDAVPLFLNGLDVIHARPPAGISRADTC